MGGRTPEPGEGPEAGGEGLAMMTGIAAAAAVLLLTAAAPDPRAPMMLDTFDDLTPWRVAASDGVSVSKAPVPGTQGGALKLSFNLGSSAGYAFSHRDLPLDLPDNFEITFFVR